GGVPADHPAQARAGKRDDVRLLLRDAAGVLREAADRRLQGRQDHDPRLPQGNGAAVRRACAGGALLGVPARSVRRAQLRGMFRCLPLRAASADHGAPPRRADGSPVTDRLWLRTVTGLFAGLVAAAAVVLYLGISQRELIASLHGLADEPLFLAALGGLVLMALQALRWWVAMRPVLGLDYGQAFRALMVGF